MNEIEKAYIAGYFDGEGSIQISVCTMKSSNGVKRPYHRLQVGIGNYSVLVINLLYKEFGGLVEKRLLHKRKEYTTWRISSQAALIFLNEIVDFLKQKRQEALLAIYFQTQKRNLNFEQRENIRYEIHNLKNNQRKLVPHQYTPKSSRYHDYTYLNPYNLNSNGKC